MSRVPCTYCTSEWGEPNEAATLAPQQDVGNTACFIYRPVCAEHSYAWYEGALFDEEEAPMVTLPSVKGDLA